MIYTHDIKPCSICKYYSGFTIYLDTASDWVEWESNHRTQDNFSHIILRKPYIHVIPVFVMIFVFHCSGSGTRPLDKPRSTACTVSNIMLQIDMF